MLRASGVTDDEIKKINDSLTPELIAEIEEIMKKQAAMQTIFSLTGMSPQDDTWG